ncbi:GNAT family N-acetyltransferase [Ferrimonas futtsuensis]|uniref:GNAT family N-acetyltransferase n=1 Tax=Ferrimonas futtsuensis TaxID=364764 RepID=UPI00146DADA6|nr:GNAT family N-acetyltransferase [Ferrimonas futtsuensis]
MKTLQQCRLRTALAEDASDLVAIHYASVHQGTGNHYPVEVLRAWSPPPDPHRSQWLHSVIVSDNALVEVAEDLGQGVVGFGIVLLGQSRLQALYIHPGASGAGVGRRLLNHLEQRASQVGLTRLSLNASLNAHPFYTRMGYVTQGPSSQALTDEVVMQALAMEKSLL